MSRALSGRSSLEVMLPSSVVNVLLRRGAPLASITKTAQRLLRSARRVRKGRLCPKLITLNPSADRMHSARTAHTKAKRGQRHKIQSALRQHHATRTRKFAASSNRGTREVCKVCIRLPRLDIYPWTRVRAHARFRGPPSNLSNLYCLVRQNRQWQKNEGTSNSDYECGDLTVCPPGSYVYREATVAQDGTKISDLE